MAVSFTLAPRYRLDDELPWLEGIDPSRHYWLWVNGEKTQSVVLDGLIAATVAELRQVMAQFHSLQPGAVMQFNRAATTITIHCVADNCYAIADTVESAPIWHLFDQETLESLLMTAHPDWQCASRDLELGRRWLMRSWSQPVAV